MCVFKSALAVRERDARPPTSIKIPTTLWLHYKRKQANEHKKYQKIIYLDISMRRVRRTDIWRIETVY